MRRISVMMFAERERRVCPYVKLCDFTKAYTASVSVWGPFLCSVQPHPSSSMNLLRHGLFNLPIFFVNFHSASSFSTSLIHIYPSLDALFRMWNSLKDLLQRTQLYHPMVGMLSPESRRKKFRPIVCHLSSSVCSSSKYNFRSFSKRGEPGTWLIFHSGICVCVGLFHYGRLWPCLEELQNTMRWVPFLCSTYNAN